MERHATLRRFAGAFVAASVLVVGSAGAAVGAREDTTVKRPPSQAAVAKQLAGRVTSARTPAARYRALLAVMKALHVGVYTAAGKAVVRGGERTSRGFVFFDFELRAIAAAYARGQEYDSADLARLLSALGAAPGGAPVKPEAAHRYLLVASRLAAKRPRLRTTLALQLVRELGRRHARPYDLASEVPAERLRLDPLQYALIGADLAIPLVRTLLPAEGSARPPRQLSARSGCLILKLANEGPAALPYMVSKLMLDQIKGELDKLAAQTGGEVLKELVNELLGVVETLKQAERLTDRVNLALAIKDALHGMLLAFSIKAQAITTGEQQTHYGPAGHAAEAGKELRFQMIVAMLDNYGPAVVECLNDLGIAEIPKKGPIEGVKVLWAGEENLKEHGSVRYEPADQRTGACDDKRTNPGCGIATLVFTPKDEVVVGFGEQRVTTGVLEPYPLYQLKFGNLPGSLAQFITPKFAGPMPWAVRHHKPRGFKFSSALRWRIEHDHRHHGVSHYQYEASGYRVCGEDPYSRRWEGSAHMHGQAVEYEPDVVDDRTQRDLWLPGATDHSVGQFAWHSDNGAHVDAELVAGPPLQVRITPHIDPRTHPDTADDITITIQNGVTTIEEDTSCPEND